MARMDKQSNVTEKQNDTKSGTSGSTPRSRGRSKKKKAGGSQMRGAARDESPLGYLRRNFQACTRCSHFLTGFQALIGLPRLTELAAFDSDWMDVHWTAGMRGLLLKSFGGRLDLEADYFSGICPDCHRLYEYEAGDEEDGPVLHLQVNPRLRR